MSSYNRDGSTIRFFFYLNTLCSIVGSVEAWRKWTHEIYILKYLAVTCHKLSHFNSRVFTFDFIWNCCRLLEAKFSRNPGQSKCITREIKYHVPTAELLKRNVVSQVAGQLTGAPGKGIYLLFDLFLFTALFFNPFFENK